MFDLPLLPAEWIDKTTKQKEKEIAENKDKEETYSCSFLTLFARFVFLLLLFFYFF